jgi:hypothetical protein
MIKNLETILLSLFLVTLAVSPVLADNDSTPPGKTKRERNEIRQTIQERIRNLILQKRELKPLKNLVAHIIDGVVTAISGTTLTVSKDGTTYTVNTDDKTKFRRHFWGKSSLSEISVGNHVNVWGKFTDDNRATILARLIRNLSVRKRRGAFFGTITSVSGNTFVIQTLNKGNLTVTVSGTTKLVNRREQSITMADLKVGHRVRVKGLWDKTLSKITKVAEVKDFSLPPKPTP